MTGQQLELPVLCEWLGQVPAERWPVVRQGQREPVPPFVRRLIFERDGGRCLSCGDPLTLRAAQLDHIVPWAAGGPDDSWNLRLLCAPCNRERSNFRGPLDYMAARRVPVASTCASCAHLDAAGREVCGPFPVTPDMVAAFCGWCGLVSRTWPEWAF